MIRKIVLSAGLLAIGLRSFSINPSREYKVKPDGFGYEYKEVDVHTADQVLIKTWLYSPVQGKDKNTTIIISCTDAGNMTQVIVQANLLRERGYTVVTYDYRGFGESADFNYSKDNLYHDEYVKDLEAVHGWAQKNFPQNKIGLYGLSMGSIVTVLFSKIATPDFFLFDALVVDPTLIKTRLNAIKNVNVVVPESANGYRGLLTKIEEPTLIFAANKDKITRYEDYADVLSKAEIIVYNGAHLETFIKLSSINEERFKYGSKCIDYMATFIDNSLPK